MDKNQILFTEIEKRIKDITAEMDFYYKKIDKLDAICEELERLLSLAESDGEENECIERLEFDECFEKDDEELNGLKKDYSEVCNSFDEFKKQFDSMINKNKVHCRDCDGEMILDSDGEEDYYYCEKCGYECYPDENGVGFHDGNCCCDKCEPTFCACCGEKVKVDDDGYYYCGICEYEYCPDEDDDEEDFEDCTITCRKCCGDMFEEIDEDGDVYYECSNCGRVEYM